jgi:hypothetical protein
MRTKFNTIIMCQEKSSSLATVAYDPRTEVLEVTFKAAKNPARYRYYEVEPGTFARLVNAESMGKAFNTQISGQYRRRKLTQPSA